MSTEVQTALQAELAAITARLKEAKTDEAKRIVAAQYEQRVAHIQERLQPPADPQTSAE